MNGVPRESFTDALEKAFEMQHDEARELADVVLDRFEGHEEVDDETLDAEVRSVFYTLEAKRMISFRRIEYVREDGDKRRGFFWKLRPEAIVPATAHAVPVQDMDVYADLPASAWRHAA